MKPVPIKKLPGKDTRQITSPVRREIFSRYLNPLKRKK